MKALLARDGEWAVTSARSYHLRVDRAIKDMLGALLAAAVASPQTATPVKAPPSVEPVRASAPRTKQAKRLAPKRKAKTAAKARRKR
jgi:hypothetical protein